MKVWCVMLQALHPLIQDADNAATRDNAAGAVGRMLASMPLQLPLDQVLPVLLSKPPQSMLPCSAALCLSGSAMFYLVFLTFSILS